MKANIHRLIILGVIISITFGTHAQGILLQKKINRIHRLLENEEIQDVGMQLSKLDEKYPYHPLVYWYKLRYHLLLGEDTQQYYPLLDEAKRLYSLQSPKEKNLIQKFFTLSDLKEMYLQLDEEMLDNIRENCNKKDADFFKKNRGESPQFNQFIEIYENCELNKILEYPTVEKLNEFMQKTNNDLRHKAKKIVDSLLYHNLKKNYRFQTALKFYFDYPNHPQKKTIEEDLFYWYTLDGVLDSFIKYVLLFESSPLREDALKYVILLKNYNNSDVQEARPLTIEQDSLQSIINIKNNYLDFYQINKQWNVLLADGNKYLLPQNLGEFKGGFPCDSSIPYFIFEKKRKTELLNLLGEKVKLQPFDALDVKGPFLIFKNKVFKNKVSFSVAVIGIHKRMLKGVDEIKQMSQKWIIYSQEGKDKIFMLNGYTPQALTFDKIETQNNHFIFTNKGRKNLLSFDNLLDFIRNEHASLALPYDDVIWLYDNVFLIKNKKQQGLIDGDGKEILKLSHQKITYQPPFLFVKTKKELLVKNAKSFTDILNTQKVIAHNLDFFHKKQNFWLTPYAPELAAEEVEWIIDKVWIVTLNDIPYLYFSSINQLVQIPKSANLIVPSIGNSNTLDVQSVDKTFRINQNADTVMTFNGYPLIDFPNSYFVNLPQEKKDNLFNNNERNRGYFTNQYGERIWNQESINVEKVNEKYAIGKEKNKFIIYEMKHRYKSDSLYIKPTYIKSSFFYLHDAKKLKIIDMNNPKNETIFDADRVVKLDTIATPPFVWIKKDNSYSCFTLNQPIDTLVFKAKALTTRFDNYYVYTMDDEKKGMISSNLHIKPRWDAISFNTNEKKMRIRAYEKGESMHFSRYIDRNNTVLFDKFEPISTVWFACQK